MLSTAAFNAFLKTLEEPPPYAIFILATTEKHKILPTILSRCQVFDFRRITVKDMVAHLEQIAKQEGIKAERDALVTIAQKSDGALRDALSLFDRLASAAEKNLTYQSVIQNLNILDYDMYFQIADACLREDVRDVLLLYDKIVMGGFEGDTFLDGLATHYRDLLVCRDPATLALQEHSEELKDRYQKQASLMSASYIFSALNLINACDIAYPQVRNKRLHVEIALSRICFLRRLQEGNPFTTEKKTVDGNASAELTSEKEIDAPAPTSRKESVPKVPNIALKSNGHSASAAKEETQDTPVKPPAPKPVTPKKSKTSVGTHHTPATGAIVLDTPQLGSLFDLKTHVERTEQIAKANSLELTEGNIVTWWNEFRQSLSSPSVSVAFKEASVTLEGKTLKIVVDSVLAKTRIQEESELLLSFRNAFHDQELEIDIIVEESDELREARKPKKILTVREKYELLVAKNPAMEELKDKLGLVVDHDE